MYLADTNIILEILLEQEKESVCRKFLNDYSEEICIADYSIFSIGNILFRNNAVDLFLTAFKEIREKLFIRTLVNDRLDNVTEPKEKFKLDFDDSYQYQVAKEYGLTLVTLDQHFKNVDGIKTLFL